MNTNNESFLNSEIRVRLEKVLKQTSQNYTWNYIRSLSDEQLTDLTLDKLDRKEKKKETKLAQIFTLQQRFERLYPNFSEMYPQIDISTLPENQLERIVSGIPLYEVFGFSSNPLYSSLQLQEQEDAKLKHRTAYSDNGRSPKSSQVQVGNKGISDRNYFG